MPSGELILFLVLLLFSVLLIALAVPLLCGCVPPNRLYGFRTPQTLRDPEVWYSVNRVCGFWIIVTGVITAGVAAASYAAGALLGFGVFFTLAALLCGVIVMAVQSDAASRKSATASKPVRLQFRLLALFVVTTLVAIGCAIARIPAPWVFKVGLLWTYVIVTLGLVLRNAQPRVAKAD